MHEKTIAEKKPFNPFVKPADTPLAGAGSAQLLAKLRQLTGGK